MRNVLLLSLLISLNVEAQELQLWNCQSTNSTGFNWNTEEGYRWESKSVPNSSISITINGLNSFYDFNSQSIPLSCEEFTNEKGENLISCIRNDQQPHDFLLLNLASGQASLSRLGGAVSSNTFFRELVSTSIFQCTN
jgi:hypothetical protein